MLDKLVLTTKVLVVPAGIVQFKPLNTAVAVELLKLLDETPLAMTAPLSASISLTPLTRL